MNSTWAWIVGIGAALLLVGLLFFGGSDRRAYRQARGVIEQRAGLRQDRIDTAVDLATKAVDLALVRAGDLPSQQAKADLLKQDIEVIGQRLKDVAGLQGEAAVAQLDQSIAQFDATLQVIEDACKEASDPLVKLNWIASTACSRLPRSRWFGPVSRLRPRQHATFSAIGEGVWRWHRAPESGSWQPSGLSRWVWGEPLA